MRVYYNQLDRQRSTYLAMCHARSTGRQAIVVFKKHAVLYDPFTRRLAAVAESFNGSVHSVGMFHQHAVFESSAFDHLMNTVASDG